MLPASTYRAFARECPTRPVRLVVAFAAGGGTDIAARVIGQWLSLRLGQSFLIENRPGAGSSAAAELVVNAPPDGYTLLACGLANAVNATLYSKLPYNFGRDLAPVAGLINTPNITVVNPSFPAKSVLEFIPHAKANPGKLNMASAGVGSGTHMTGELFKTRRCLNQSRYCCAATSGMGCRTSGRSPDNRGARARVMGS